MAPATNGSNGSSTPNLLKESVVPSVLDNSVWSSLTSTYALNDPHSGEKLYEVSSVTVDNCLDAVESASKAFKSWKNTGAAERRAIFNRAAQLLIERKDEFVKLQLEETTGNGFWG